MSDPLWKLLEIILKIEIQKNPEKAIIMIEDLIYNNFNEMKILDRIKAFERLNKILENSGMEKKASVAQE